ncbi:hypothetical protein B0I35DRAFT_476023 [Stachybotrys elegans]|uniref:Rhodopsin domain-containing protein n=1 Tax=Stachybotrys elegans TaxID=80388 RepID=A0A8K0SYI0_9HYPO|nr:hypothetical protein B0I35DRAFT_476023 [Stachybotrys elegans]
MRLALVSDRTGLIIMTVIFTLLIITCVFLRFRARNITKAGLQVDDWLALVALVLTLALNGVFLAGTIEGAITGHSIVVNGRPVTNDLEILMQRYKYAYQTMEKVVFGMIKLSILFLWKRLFGTSRTFTIISYVMIAIVACWMVAFFFETVFQCGTNWPLNWAPIYVFLAECTASLDVLTVFGVTDVVTDLIIIAMPIPLIWSLQMPRNKKIAVTGIFALGFFTTGAAVARLFYYLATSYNQEENPDFIGDVTLTLLWSTIEANVAMTVCCLPVLGPIFGGFRDKVVTMSRRSGINKWVDITNDRSSARHSYHLSKLEDGIMNNRSSSSQKEMWHEDHAIIATAGFSGAAESHDHQTGILARTEISTTFEDNPRPPVVSYA